MPGAGLAFRVLENASLVRMGRLTVFRQLMGRKVRVWGEAGHIGIVVERMLDV